MSNVDPSVAAIQFALTLPEDEIKSFLACWNEGDWEGLKEDWPECPTDVIVDNELELSKMGQNDLIIIALQALHRERSAAWNSQNNYACVMNSTLAMPMEAFGIGEVTELLEKFGAGPLR